MKSILAIVLTLILCLSLATPVFAHPGGNNNGGGNQGGNGQGGGNQGGGNGNGNNNGGGNGGNDPGCPPGPPPGPGPGPTVGKGGSSPAGGQAIPRCPVCQLELPWTSIKSYQRLTIDKMALVWDLFYVCPKCSYSNLRGANTLGVYDLNTEQLRLQKIHPTKPDYAKFKAGIKPIELPTKIGRTL